MSTVLEEQEGVEQQFVTSALRKSQSQTLLLLYSKPRKTYPKPKKKVKRVVRRRVRHSAESASDASIPLKESVSASNATSMGTDTTDEHISILSAVLHYLADRYPDTFNIIDTALHDYRNTGVSTAMILGIEDGEVPENTVPPNVIEKVLKSTSDSVETACPTQKN